MFKAIRITILLLILIVVALNSWLTMARTTDWDESLWVTVYPINADDSNISKRFQEQLSDSSFKEIERFFEREATRYGRTLKRPIRVQLGQPVNEQPPKIDPAANVPAIMWWSLKMRLWASHVVSSQDAIPPDIKIFLRLHNDSGDLRMDNSMGLRKGMIGIVNARAGRSHQRMNNIIITHELLHTLGATDKYDLATGQPLFPDGVADVARNPLYPQSKAEIMAGRIALSNDTISNPGSLSQVVIGTKTALEIGLSQ
jgi:hypothetical protein